MPGLASVEPVELLPGTFQVPWTPGDAAALVGSRCRACATTVFPKRVVCPACLEPATMEPLSMGRRARLYSYTLARVAPAGFTAPYFQAYVDLPEGPRIFTLISDEVPRVPEALEEGMEMELVVEAVRHDEAGRPVLTYKYRPLAPRGGRR